MRRRCGRLGHMCGFEVRLWVRAIHDDPLRRDSIYSITSVCDQEVLMRSRPVRVEELWSAVVHFQRSAWPQRHGTDLGRGSRISVVFAENEL